MTSKGARDAIASKLGLKSGGSKPTQADLDRVLKENAQLKKMLDDALKRGAKQTSPDKEKLLERILSLETLREKNGQQLLARDQEVESLRQQLRLQGGEAVAALQDQLDKRQKEAEQRERQVRGLLLETEELKNKLLVASEKCQELESRSTATQVPSGEVRMVQEQLRDAMEKNQQWLVYDQQREAYVQGILANMEELKQQLDQTKKALQQPDKEAESQGHGGQEKLLQETQRALVEERARSSRLQDQLEELRGRCEERGREAQQAFFEQRSSRQALEEERRLAKEGMARLQGEVDAADIRLGEERKRSDELAMQLNLLQKSLVNQREEQNRIALLEKQVQMSAKDIEKEKLDRQNLQHQLNKLLKELRRARDQIASLESLKHQRESRFSEPSSYNSDWASGRDRILTPSSPVTSNNQMDESFLECPNCRALYPTSHHRELLAHLDYCFN